MCRKVVSVVMLLLACSASCWGEARPLASIDQRSATSEQPSQPLSTLWQKADESLRIIEESLIAQGEPVQNLSKDLPELYQKSQELQESVNALSQRFESLEKSLLSIEIGLEHIRNTIRTSSDGTIHWNASAISGVFGTLIGFALFHIIFH